MMLLPSKLWLRVLRYVEGCVLHGLDPECLRLQGSRLHKVCKSLTPNNCVSSVACGVLGFSCYFCCMFVGRARWLFFLLFTVGCSSHVAFVDVLAHASLSWLRLIRILSSAFLRPRIHLKATCSCDAMLKSYHYCSCFESSCKN